jgi:hypothetical protein
MLSAERSGEPAVEHQDNMSVLMKVLETAGTATEIFQGEKRGSSIQLDPSHEESAPFCGPYVAALPSPAGSSIMALRPFAVPLNFDPILR